HTYLDGTRPFMSQGSWAVGASHSTATFSLGSRRSTALSAPALDASLRSASPGREGDGLGRRN
ncbi:hypothetical protein DICSQDRAFT_62395, partial [Dichomitus squalens LYAD-421 SS1]